MPRAVTTTMQNAIDAPGSFSFISKATVYPSNIFFDTIQDDNPITGADETGVLENPLAQDIEYDAATGLVTFYSEDGVLKYAVQGDSTPVTTSHVSLCKPGVAMGKIYLSETLGVRRYTIDYSAIASRSTAPLIEDDFDSLVGVYALHGISATEYVAIVDDGGVFGVKYMNGGTEITASSRFMFPKIVEWDGSSRTMASLSIFSTAAKLGSRVFVYMSAAHNGMVSGIYYDPSTATWSDIFVAVPTDLSVSMCEFRIANSFVRNGKIYMCGQFNRTDSYAGSVAYSLILGSSDGLTFSVDRYCLISNLGYRFLAHVGSDNYLYIANSNRVSKKLSTWVFDGDSLETSPKTELLMSNIVGYSVTGDLSSMTMQIEGGAEQHIDNEHIREGSLVVLEVGYKTTAGDEYVTYGRFVVDSISFDRASKSRSTSIQCVHEGRWRSAGLSMPFYAEITGVSSTYDPMSKTTGLMYSAPSNSRYRTSFWVDFWESKAYSNSAEGIIGVTPVSGGGVDQIIQESAHKCGFVLAGEVRDIISAETNPEITDTSVTAKLYGWSKPNAAGNPNDIVNLVMIHTDAEGNDEQTVITAGTSRWSKTYPDTTAGSDPITVTVTGLTAGRLIKNVGMVFQQSNGTTFYPWRIEFTAGVKVPVILTDVGATWEKQDDGTFKIPGAGLPFVMFSQKPYNAFNFTLAAKFTNDVSGGIVGYPVAVGLVGLAKDAASFIVARYDKVSDRVQLVKVRSGAETQLDEAAPGFVVGDEVSIQFSHRDGNFKVYLRNPSTGRFIQLISYNWQASDGYMCESLVSSLKCGIYGMIGGPMVQTLGYTYSESETSSRSDGIPIAPLESIADFPSSGNLRIGNNVYSYTGKITPPAYVRGPSQLRAQGKWSGAAEIQVRDLNWTASKTLLTDLLIACNGYAFKIASSEWQCYKTTSGHKEWLPNRSMHFSANPSIATFPASTATRTFVTGGFTGVSMVSGDAGSYHAIRDYARLELEGTIKCHWFMGAGGEPSQTTIQDLIKSVCSLSGIPVEFPGNFTAATLEVFDETPIYQDEYAEGFDLSFELSSFTDFEIRTNIKIKPDNYEEKVAIEGDIGVKIAITETSPGNYELSVLSTPSDTEMFKMSYLSGTGLQTFRFLFHENSFSLFQCNRWVTTITFDELIYDQDTVNHVAINAWTYGTTTFENITVRDLAELREAVYIDLETDGTAAIQSIIQERPVEIVNLPGGGYQVFYEYTRPATTLALSPESHNETRKIPGDAASDAIVYGSVDVKTLQFAPFAALLGMSTKLFRLPDMNVGAVEATVRMLKKAYQRRKMTNIACRPQLGPQIGERLAIDYTLAGLNKSVTGEIIIESVALQFQNTGKVEASMNITGREYSA